MSVFIPEVNSLHDYMIHVLWLSIFFQLVLIDGDYADLMDDNGELFSQRLPDDNIGKEIKKMSEECDDIMVSVSLWKGLLFWKNT